MKRSTFVAALVAFLGAPSLAFAQQGGPGFLFDQPNLSLGVRLGYSVPRTGGQLFDYALDEFIPLGEDTLSSLDFDGPYVGGELAIRPWERWDLALGVGWTRSRSLTEYRRWIDTDGSPLEQETTFEVVTATLGAKYYLQDRGRQVGRLAWVPQRFTPFVGGGIGFSSYEFVQVGDFVDTGDCVVVNGEESCTIFPDRLETSGEGFLAYATAGLDFALTKIALVTAEARYTFSDAEVAGSFQGFDDIDLAGLQLMIGLGLQF